MLTNSRFIFHVFRVEIDMRPYITLIFTLFSMLSTAEAKTSVDRFDITLRRVSQTRGNQITSATFCTDTASDRINITNDNEVRSRLDRICVQFQEQLVSGSHTISWMMPVHQSFSIRKAGRSGGIALNDVAVSIRFRSAADSQFFGPMLPIGQISRGCGSNDYELDGEDLTDTPILGNASKEAVLHLTVTDRDKC